MSKRPRNIVFRVLVSTGKFTIAIDGTFMFDRKFVGGLVGLVIVLRMLLHP